MTKIGENAFRACSLREADLPDSLTELGAYAFMRMRISKRSASGRDWSASAGLPSGCGALNTIEVDEENQVYLGTGNCLIRQDDGDLLLGSNQSVIPICVTSIAEDAFWECAQLKRIDIPVSVKQIGDFAFRDCRSLAEIGYGGKRSEWNAIVFGVEWCVHTAGTLTVHCSDGDIVYES